MPELERLDGIRLHWDEEGEGPAVALCALGYASPRTTEPLMAELARDHRVIRHHLRGTGESTRRGPYDLDTDAADFEAVLEVAGGPVLIVASGDGAHSAARVAARRPDLVTHLVCVNSTLGSASHSVPEALGTRAVLAALLSMMESDHRAALRAMVERTGRERDEENLRRIIDRDVAFSPHEPSVARLGAWLEDNAIDFARAVGDRLWLTYYPGNPWWPLELITAVLETMPEARRAEIEAGPISAPGEMGRLVRRIEAGAG